MAHIKNIIRRARGDKTQATFAEMLGTTQGLLSKYENGLVQPPNKIIEHCMDILGMNDEISIVNQVSADSLAKRILTELKEPESSYARQAIATLLDGIQVLYK